MSLVDAAVREDEDVAALGEGLVGLGADPVHRLLEGRAGAPAPPRPCR